MLSSFKSHFDEGNVSYMSIYLVKKEENHGRNSGGCQTSEIQPFRYQ